MALGAKEKVGSFGKGIYMLIRPTWMLALSQLSLSSLPVTSFLVMCHMSYEELIATGMGIVFCNITGLSIAMALSVACEELSLVKTKFLDAVVVLQKGVYSCLLILSFIAWAFWMNAGIVLGAFGLDPKLAGLAEDFCFSFLPGLLIFVICLFLQKLMYISDMDKVLPSLCCHFVTAVAHIFLTYMFVVQLKLGVRGAAYALIISYLCLAVLLFLCIMWEAEYRQAWPGWSWECVKGHWSYFKCVLPYIVVLAFEWWTFDFGTFIVGSIDQRALPTQLIVVLLIEFLSLVTHQFALAASAQVYDAVKGGFWKRAVFILRCSMFLTWVFSIVCGALLSGVRKFFTPLYTKDWQMTMSTAEIILLVAPIPFLRGTQALGFNVLRRLNRKILPVIIAGVGYWGISLPAALLLMYYFKRGVAGFWIGYLIGAAVQAFVFLILIYDEMRKWMDKQEMRTGPHLPNNEPVTPSGQMEMVDPFLCQDLVDGVKRSSINIELPRMHVPFDETDARPEPTASTNQGEVVIEDPRPPIRTLLLRTLVFMMAICVFVIGIGVRFFVPSAHIGHNHSYR